MNAPNTSELLRQAAEQLNVAMMTENLREKAQALNAYFALHNRAQKYKPNPDPLTPGTAGGQRPVEFTYVDARARKAA